MKAAECFLLLHMMKAHKQRQVNNSPGKLKRQQMSGFGVRVRMKLPGDQDTGMQRRDLESLKMMTLGRAVNICGSNKGQGSGILLQVVERTLMILAFRVFFVPLIPL